MIIDTIITTGGTLRNPEPATDQATLAALQQIAPLILEAIKEECPKDSGDLAASIKLGPIDYYGTARYSVKVISEGPGSEYFWAVVYGVQSPVAGTLVKIDELREWGRTGKKAFKTSDGQFFKTFVIPERRPNNFPGRGIRKVASQALNLAATTFVTRIKL